MSQKPLENDILQDALEIDAKIRQGIYLNITRASKDTGIPRSTLKNRIDRAKEKEEADELIIESVTLPDFPDPDVPADEIIDHME